jgi:hypothetical protein
MNIYRARGYTWCALATAVIGLYATFMMGGYSSPKELRTRGSASVQSIGSRDLVVGLEACVRTLIKSPEASGVKWVECGEHVFVLVSERHQGELPQDLLENHMKYGYVIVSCPDDDTTRFIPLSRLPRSTRDLFQHSVCGLSSSFGQL